MKRNILAAAALAAIAITATACEVPEDGKNAAEETIEQHESVKDKPVKDKDVKAEPTKEPEPEFTMAQEQAIASALSYIDTMAFSKKELIGQLEYEKFTPAVAAFAVDHITVDWNEQAAASAISYLDTMAFSKPELLDQLLYEGFTPEQAQYGVNKAWNN